VAAAAAGAHLPAPACTCALLAPPGTSDLQAARHRRSSPRPPPNAGADFAIYDNTPKGTFRKLLADSANDSADAVARSLFAKWAASLKGAPADVVANYAKDGVLVGSCPALGCPPRPALGCPAPAPPRPVAAVSPTQHQYTTI
jgi:hypothetical protein